MHAVGVCVLLVCWRVRNYCIHQIFTPSVILSWFVEKELVDKAVRMRQLIEEEDVECKPENVSDAVADETVDICLVRKYFTVDAWMLVEDVVQRKSDKMFWTCRSCYHDLHSEAAIICDACLLWYHFKCVGLSTLPKSKNWFCRSCYAETALK